MTVGRAVRSVTKYAVLVLFGLWSAVPIVLVVLNSFKRRLDIFKNPPSLVFEPTLSNYRKIFLTDDYLAYYRNSIAITSMTTLLSIVFGLFAAYGLVYFGLKQAGKIANIFLWVKMIPPITMLLPLSSMLYLLDLQGSYLGPVLAHTSLNLAFVIWLFMSILKELPSEIIDAATVDGCTKMQTFWFIVVPMVLPGIAACTVLCAQYSWNELLFVLQLTRLDTYTLPVGISKLAGEMAGDWGKSSAAATVTMLPIIIVGFFVQKYIAQGTTSGAVKG
ncbi:carbohydrate ABC transporter permease [Mesorhizobium sp. NPDC059025]|uniref:carbohydrate ABC transporter permease n=1 Tax=unclassified Mesorhizobium TaxID=325217 RepID=UPI00368C997C